MAFMADIAAEWIDAGENGEFAMPDSYSRLFERRVKQLAALNNIEPSDEAMVKVIEMATDLADTGIVAFLLAANDDDEVEDEPDAEASPAPKQAPRRPRQPKAEVPEPQPVEPPQPDVPVPTEPMPEVPQVEASEPQEATQPEDEASEEVHITVAPTDDFLRNDPDEQERRRLAYEEAKADAEAVRSDGEVDPPAASGLTVFNDLVSTLLQ